MKYTISFKVLLFFIALLSIFQCSYYGSKFEKEFDEFVSDSDKTVTNGDFLHPVYAYVKNSKIKGLEINNAPECGRYTKRYFLSENEEVFKIIIEKDFYNENCGGAFDSIYVINPAINEIVTYTKFMVGKKFTKNTSAELKDFDRYKKEIHNWKRK
ncbi:MULTISPECIES: hypothetical protein [Chryseobacterium]|uniref:Uncharacterized protein n=1 Tax=Chryseobacterium taihuense TaxID=1141221 RepID=A0A4U8W8Y0_9FLAO|nr:MULTISPECIES: hypothetical protein [Chryseobacterium]QQV04151.1 hypothetical protein I6I61_07400 [Chryseobacterium sp. FDAARGOS 1104]VFB02483.1 Uncharacterised protein [Chryseobacterium taihuense]